MVNNIVWICDPYSDPPKSLNRYGRYHLIGRHLRSKNYEVHIFVSNFSHTYKSFLAEDSSVVEVEGIFYHLIESCSYEQHFSFSRIFYEILYSKNLVEKWRHMERQADLILLRDPLVFQFPFLKSYLNKTRIPYLIDIIDLWPELFSTKLPVLLRRFEKYIFHFLYKCRKRYLERASLITAVSIDYISLLQDLPRVIPYRVVYWGVDQNKVNDFCQMPMSLSWANLDFVKSKDDMWVVYAGTLGENYDISIIVKAAIALKGVKNIRFFIAGKGPLEAVVEKGIVDNELDNLIYLGYINQIQMFELFSQSDIGLLTYSKLSTVSMPIKAYDYLASGLSILYCLDGEIDSILSKNNFGMKYEAEQLDSFLDALEKLYLCRDSNRLIREEIKEYSKKFDIGVQYQMMADFIEMEFFKQLK